MNILVSTAPPAHLRITETMICDFLINPVLGIRVLFGYDLDAYQRVRAKTIWWTPRVMDSSGFSSLKTQVAWMIFNLRCLLFPGHVVGVYYPSFDASKRNYVPMFTKVAAQSEIYRAQVGRQRVIGVDGKTDQEAKALHKGPSCYVFDYKNGSQQAIPAPGFLQDAKTQAGTRFHDLVVDEWTKILAMKSNDGSGESGIEKQLVGRTTLESWNKNHPIYRNHHLFLATAEDTMHPAHRKYHAFMKEIRAGNPDYAHISFSMKDLSDLPCRGGATFRERFREDMTLKDMKQNKTRAGFLQEALGIWSKNGRGWYTPDTIQKCFQLGVMQKAEVYCSRAEDPEAERALYFFGVDPSKADTAKADDGAIVGLRAVPIAGIVPDIRGYKLSPCYAFKVRKADAGQWSGIIHRKHADFGLTGIMMDPGGGGVWIQPELRKTEQKHQGLSRIVRPIATLEDEEGLMIMGDFILCMFRPKDTRIQQTWGHMPNLKMENLIDLSHEELRESLSQIAFPPYWRTLPREVTSTWSEEKKWANILISDPKIGIGAQLQQIFVQTNEDGTTFYSKPANARIFNSRTRRDFAYAFLYSFIRFLVWLKGADQDLGLPNEDDAAMCWGASPN